MGVGGRIQKAGERYFIENGCEANCRNAWSSTSVKARGHARCMPGGKWRSIRGSFPVSEVENGCRGLGQSCHALRPRGERMATSGSADGGLALRWRWRKSGILSNLWFAAFGMEPVGFILHTAALGVRGRQPGIIFMAMAGMNPVTQ
jgi:hypothetical protein